jgi:hypothetical protein
VSRTRLVEDVRALAWVVAGAVLLGAPAGLVWSAVSPRVDVTVTALGPEVPNGDSNEAFFGADGSYFLVMLVAGLLTGVIGWWLFRRSGPITVLALVVGGVLGALVAAEVGLMPGYQDALRAVSEGSSFRGHTDLYLGRLQPDRTVGLRASWAFVAWPAGACISFLLAALRRPHDLDLAPSAPLGVVR